MTEVFVLLDAGGEPVAETHESTEAFHDYAFQLLGATSTRGFCRNHIVGGFIWLQYLNESGEVVGYLVTYIYIDNLGEFQDAN